MIIVPFTAEHLQQIDVQAEQSLASHHFHNKQYTRALEAHDSWTGLIDDKVVACAGFITLWPGRHQVWAVISATIGPAGMLQLSRAVLRALALKTGRIEAVVASEFEAGHRWARLMGFSLETPQPMRHWFPEGGDASLYSRIQ